MTCRLMRVARRRIWCDHEPSVKSADTIDTVDIPNIVDTLDIVDTPNTL